MRVTALLADHAEVANSKLYINGGGWTTWWAESAPLRVPAMALVILIGVPYTATNEQHRFAAFIVDEDGGQVALPVASNQPGAPAGVMATRIDGEFTVGRPPQLPPGDEQVVPFAINMPGLTLPRFGSYSVVVEVDGVEHARMPFRLAPRPAGNPRH